MIINIIIFAKFDDDVRQLFPSRSLSEQYVKSLDTHLIHDRLHTYGKAVTVHVVDTCQLLFLYRSSGVILPVYIDVKAN